MSTIPDPFRDARHTTGVLGLPSEKELIPMILRHEDVRKACKDWHTFSSDAPRRVPIPSEEHLRHVRQLPLEVDPPDQTDYRQLVEPFFLRAKQPAFVARIEELTQRMLADALGRDSIEIVSEFALPLQSKALTILLDVPESEAELFVSWGVHIFHGEHGVQQAAALEQYLTEQFDRVAADPGDDFYGMLTKVTFRERSLTRDEMLGFANIMFAGGRDTIIHSVACAIGYLAEHPESLEFLRADPSRVIHASEEFFRAYMPLTHIGRVCPIDTDVHGIEVKAGDRASLCWASANLDEQVFEMPGEVRLDRKPNPHVSFGFGAHLCLGAAHARTVMRVLLGLLCRHVETIDLISQHQRVEHTPAYDRELGYESLIVKMHAIQSPLF